MGYNVYGQLGNGTADNKSVPIQAGTEVSNVLVVHEVTLASSIDDNTPMGKTGTYGGDNTVISNITLRGDNGENKYDAFNVSSTSVARKFNLNLGVDEEKRLTSSDRLTFKSMNPEIVTVDSAGNVRPAHKGNYGSTVILVEYNYNDLGVVNKFKGMIRVKVAPYMGVASPMVAAGAGHTIALRYDGTVWAWGYNGNGELGQGNTTSVYSPVQVKSADGNSYLTDIIEIAAGSNHNLALAKDGTVWSWGYNYHGQLGNGTKANSSLPVKVKIGDGSVDLTGVVSIAAGYYSSFAVRKDGTVWAWGYNNAGQLGLGDGANRTTAQQVLGGAREVNI